MVFFSQIQCLLKNPYPITEKQHCPSGESTDGKMSDWPPYCVFFQMKEHVVFKKKRILLLTHLSEYDDLLSSCAIPDQCSLTANEQWQNEQGIFRQTIRQALKQRLHGSKCSRLITSVMCK